MGSAGSQNFGLNTVEASFVTFTALGYTPEQPDLEIALLNPLEGGMHYDEETKAAFKVLLDKGALGAGVLKTPDCRDHRQSVVPRFSSAELLPCHRQGLVRNLAVAFAFARVPTKN